MSETHRPDARGRRTLARTDRPATRLATVPDDRFFRQIVRSMRNGVIAFRRDGTIALMNDEAYRRQTPLGRNGGAEEVAQAIRFLVSDAASFITGAILDINGGRFLR